MRWVVVFPKGHDLPGLAETVALARPARLGQHLVQRPCQLLGPRVVVAGNAVVPVLKHVELIGDVERGQHGDAQRIHCGCLLRDQSHLGVYISGQLRDIFRVGAPEMIGLIVNFDTDTAVAVGLIQASLPCQSG